MASVLRVSRKTLCTTQHLEQLCSVHLLVFLSFSQRPKTWSSGSCADTYSSSRAPTCLPCFQHKHINAIFLRQSPCGKGSGDARPDDDHIGALGQRGGGSVLVEKGRGMVVPEGRCGVRGGETGVRMLVIGGVFIDDQHVDSLSLLLFATTMVCFLLFCLPVEPVRFF